jgi:hypothetical protein
MKAGVQALFTSKDKVWTTVFSMTHCSAENRKVLTRMQARTRLFTEYKFSLFGKHSDSERPHVITKVHRRSGVGRVGLFSALASPTGGPPVRFSLLALNFWL